MSSSASMSITSTFHHNKCYDCSHCRCIAQVHQATLKRKLPRRNRHGMSARNDGTILAHSNNNNDSSSSSSSSGSGSRSGSGSDGNGSAGDAVVVKVLHPGVRAQVSADMDLLGACAWTVEQLPLLGLQYLSLRQLVGEFDKVSYF